MVVRGSDFIRTVLRDERAPGWNDSAARKGMNETKIPRMGGNPVRDVCNRKRGFRVFGLFFHFRNG